LLSALLLEGIAKGYSEDDFILAWVCSGGGCVAGFVLHFCTSGSMQGPAHGATLFGSHRLYKAAISPAMRFVVTPDTLADKGPLEWHLELPVGSVKPDGLIFFSNDGPRQPLLVFEGKVSASTRVDAGCGSATWCQGCVIAACILCQ
jgi:hypothetical protein